MGRRKGERLSGRPRLTVSTPVEIEIPDRLRRPVLRAKRPPPREWPRLSVCKLNNPTGDDLARPLPLVAEAKILAHPVEGRVHDFDCLWLKR